VIKGTLVDNSEGSPLEYASVALYTQSEDSLVTGSVTNAEGTFLLENIDKGEYYLLAQFMGYQQKRMGPFNISKDQVIDFGELSLEINQQMLEEIQVTGEMVTAIHKIDRQVFEADQFQTAQGGTASELLRNLPSVTMNANGEITARGVTGFVVLINGKPIQSDAQTFLNQIPANSVQNIEFITAPSAKYDPEGNAGIINIITIQSAAEGTFVQFNARLGAPSIEDYDNADNSQRYGSDFTLNHRKNSWDISFGASYLRNDINGRREGDVSTVVNDTIHRFPSDGERSFDETNYSASLTVGYTPDKNNNYSLGFYAGKRSKDRTADILYYDNHAIYEGNRIYTIQYFNENLRIRTSDFALGSFDYRHQFENKSLLTTSILYEYTLLGGPTTNRNLAWPNTEEVLQDEFNTNDNPLHGFRFQLDYAHKPVSVGLIEAGYQFRNLDHTGDFLYQRKNLESGIWELVPEFSSEVDLQRFIHSGYGQISGTKGSWNYAGGLRLEFMDRKLQLQDKAATVDTTYQYDFLKLYPSASLQYQVNDNLQLKAAYSKRVERTTTFKMNPFPEREHSETLEQGDPELLPEFIDLVEIGAVKYIQEQSIFATAYYRYTKNVVNRVNTVYNDTILNRIYSNVGNGEYLGLEFGSDLKLKNRWKAFLGGNIYYYKLRGFFDNRSVNNSSWIYSINANTTLRMDKGWSIQGTVNYLSSRVTAQGEDGRFFSPNLTVRKSFMNDRLAATLQWLNIDMGLWGANEQRITTSRPNEFFTTTNYVYEVDMVILNLSYTLKSGIKNKSRFIKSEFGEKEF
jgi:outer membrane receptor protein involved in Fe transport